MKILKIYSIAMTGLLLFSSTHPVFANDEEMELLKQQVQLLISQNQKLTERINELEQHLKPEDSASQPEETASSSVPEELLRTKVQQVVRKEMRKQQEAEGKSQKINDYVTLFGLIEGEAVFGDDFSGESFSEFNVATVELGLDAQVNEWVLGHILAKYDGGEDNNDLFIDEANIWIGNYQKFPVLMTAGLFYMPFGNFETNMIQDPLTLEIGEINAPGVAIGFKSGGIIGSLYSYKGLTETGSSDTIKGFGAMLQYVIENESFSADAGVSVVNNIADSDGISDNLDSLGLDSVEKLVPGIGVHLIAATGPFSFIGEYLQATDSFAAYELAFNGQGAKPKAWNVEIAYTTELLNRQTVFAVGYQGTSEALDLDLPYSRYIGAASMVLFEGTALTLEYYFDKDYDVEDGGSGEDANVFTAQLAYEF